MQELLTVAAIQMKKVRIDRLVEWKFSSDFNTTLLGRCEPYWTKKQLILIFLFYIEM